MVTDLHDSSSRAIEMGEHLGFNFAQILTHDPELNALRFRRVVLRCATCQRIQDCDAVLGATDTLDHPPEFCCNATALEALRRF